MTIEIDNHTLTYLLGYLTPKQWIDALNSDLNLDKKLINKLIDEQERHYGGIKSEIDELLKEQVIRRLEK